MRRLLLIQSVLWCLVSAISEEDLSLIKQVELLSRNTYNLVMQNKLEFSTYAAKLVVDCKAANATELNRWQHWLDMSDNERMNITEEAITQFVEGIRSHRRASYNHYIPESELQDNLNSCTNYSFWHQKFDYQQRNTEILLSFGNEVSPKMKKVSNATRQADLIFFKFFDLFVQSGNEYLFMFIRSKLIRYEDTALLIEVKDLAKEAMLHFDRSYMNYIKTQLEAIISCEVVNQTDMESVKYLLGLINEKIDTLTDREFLIISKAVSDNLPRFEHREHRDEFLNCLKNFTPGILEDTAVKIGSDFEGKLENFIKKANPKLLQVSEVTKQLNKKIFEYFTEISKTDNRLDSFRNLSTSLSQAVVP